MGFFSWLCGGLEDRRKYEKDFKDVMDDIIKNLCLPDGNDISYHDYPPHIEIDCDRVYGAIVTDLAKRGKKIYNLSYVTKFPDGFYYKLENVSLDLKEEINRIFQARFSFEIHYTNKTKVRVLPLKEDFPEGTILSYNGYMKYADSLKEIGAKFDYYENKYVRVTYESIP